VGRARSAASRCRVKWRLDTTCRPDERGEDGGVVASSGANVDDRLTRSRSSFGQATCVQRWLAVVDPSFGCETYQDVLIEKSWIIRDGRDVARSDEDRPRAFADVVLPRHRRESFDEPLA